MPPLAWTRLWTSGPARALGIAAPTIEEGANAQVTIIDPQREWTVELETFASRGRNVPPNLRALRGRVSHTIVDGSVAFEL